MLKMMKMVTIEQMHTLCNLNNKETPRCSRGVVINEKDVDAADVEDGHDLITIHSSSQADLFLAQALDHEVAAEHQVRLWLFTIIIIRKDKELLPILTNYMIHQVLLTLTDGHLGRDNFISQSVIV